MAYSNWGAEVWVWHKNQWWAVPDLCDVTPAEVLGFSKRDNLLSDIRYRFHMLIPISKHFEYICVHKTTFQLITPWSFEFKAGIWNKKKNKVVDFEYEELVEALKKGKLEIPDEYARDMILFCTSKGIYSPYDYYNEAKYYLRDLQICVYADSDINNRIAGSIAIDNRKIVKFRAGYLVGEGHYEWHSDNQVMKLKDALKILMR